MLVVLVDVPPSWYNVKARKTKRILPLQSVAVTCASHAPSKDALGCAEGSCCAESEAGVRIRAARAIVETSDFRVIFCIFVVFLVVGCCCCLSLFKRIFWAVLHKIALFLALPLASRSAETDAMEVLPGSERGQSEPFAPTHWSVILAAGESETAPEIAEPRWPNFAKPIGRRFILCAQSGLCHARRAGSHPELFCVSDRAENLRARRSAEGQVPDLPAASLKNFLADAYDREQRLKRGGARFSPLDEDRAEAAESFFRRTFHRTETEY